VIELRSLSALAALGLVVAGCGGNAQGEVDDRPRSTVTVYDIVEVDGEARLDPHRVRTDADDPVVASVDALLRHEPADGHATWWNGECSPGHRVASGDVGERRVVLRIELDEDLPGTGIAVCDLDGVGTELQRQQVAWTVRTSLGRDVSVKVVDGSGYAWPAVEADARFLAEQLVASGSTGGRYAWSATASVPSACRAQCAQQ
jgi:hypothetical protein